MAYTEICGWSLGGGGFNILKSFHRQCGEDIQKSWKWFALDTNPDALTAVAKEWEALVTVHIGGDKVKGSGTVPAVARTAFVTSIEDVKQKLQGTEVVFVFATLGKGTGTGVVAEFVKLCKSMEILVIVVVAVPSVEGLEISAQGRNKSFVAIRELEKQGVRFVQYCNDAIYRDEKLKKLDHDESRAALDSIVARSVSLGLVTFFAFPTETDHADYELNIMQELKKNKQAGRLKMAQGEVCLEEAEFAASLEKAWQAEVKVAYYEVGEVGINALLLYRGFWGTDQLLALKDRITKYTKTVDVLFQVLPAKYALRGTQAKDNKKKTPVKGASSSAASVQTPEEKKIGEFMIVFATNSPYANQVQPTKKKETVETTGNDKAPAEIIQIPLRRAVQEAREGKTDAANALRVYPERVTSITEDNVNFCFDGLVRLHELDPNFCARPLAQAILGALEKGSMLKARTHMPLAVKAGDKGEKKDITITPETSREEILQAVKLSTMTNQAIINRLRWRVFIWEWMGKESADRLILPSDAPMDLGQVAQEETAGRGLMDRLLSPGKKPN